MHQIDQRALAQQWQKTAEAMVQATYGRGPQAMTSAIATTMRKLTEDLVKAGKEMVRPAAAIATALERQACADLLRKMADEEDDDERYGCVVRGTLRDAAKAIEDRSLSPRSEEAKP